MRAEDYVQIPEAVDSVPLRRRWLLGSAGPIRALIDQGAEAIHALRQSRTPFAPEPFVSYVERHARDPQWIVSRLQMYWNSKSKDVFVRGPLYSHCNGGPAPVATVRFPGSRDKTTIYTVPRVERLLPYSEDGRGVYLWNREKDAMEWADVCKTGRAIQDINLKIMQMARQAAILWEITGEHEYAQFAFDIIETYLSGIYYRAEPIDLSRGHHQTIIGLTSFEVIHEEIVVEIADTKAILWSYISDKANEKTAFFDEGIKRWLDVIIKNGVPFNNWNYYTGRVVMEAASALGNDSSYLDGRGSRWYLDRIVNISSARQWSLIEMIRRGFDAQTGIWSECPQYAIDMANKVADMIDRMDQLYGVGILNRVPVVEKGIWALPQYLFPNWFTTAYGDSLYQRVPAFGALALAAYMRRHGQVAREQAYRQLSAAFAQWPPSAMVDPIPRTAETIAAGMFEALVTRTFYAENASYFVQRSGYRAGSGLMAVLHGSSGNHMHANGIAMELYGNGLVLGPSSGFGSGFFQSDYAEYYSQFPAHNTVVVDGISAYPVMRANHKIELQNCYPPYNERGEFFPYVTFSDIYFREPETNSDQSRLTTIVRLTDTRGYYVDIFRSRRRDGTDLKHDYFYQNLGHSLDVCADDGSAIGLEPTSDLAFSDGDLFAYDYLTDKRGAACSKDIEARFTLNVQGDRKIMMDVWMKGYPARNIYVAQAPRSTALDGHPWQVDRMVPPEIAAMRLPKLVVRQLGEAWTRPFVAVYEPSTSTEERAIEEIVPHVPTSGPPDFVGLRITAKGGAKQYVFACSEDESDEVIFSDMRFRGTFAIVSKMPAQLEYMFLGHGYSLKCDDCEIRVLSNRPGLALFSRAGTGWYFECDQPTALIVSASDFGSGKLAVTVGEQSVILVGEPVGDETSRSFRFLFQERIHYCRLHPQ